MLFIKKPITLAGVILALVILCFSTGFGLTENYRSPAWAGTFYPAEPKELKDQLRQLCQQAIEESDPLATHGRIRALILPHAGYSYSGPTAAHAARVLHKGQFNKVILIGPDHKVGFAGGAISAVTAYRTPLGDIPLHADAEKLLQQGNLFHSDMASDRSEHSLEVVLPFLQYLLGDFSLVPIVLGPGKIKPIAQTLRPLIDSKTLLVISSDLSHFLSYKNAKVKDQHTIEAILNLDGPALNKRNSACGQYGLQLLIMLAREFHWQPVLLHYANSGDTAGTRDRVVGYCSIAFFQNQSPLPLSVEQQLTMKQGRILLRLSRQTIGKSLGRQPDPKEEQELTEALQDNIFSQNRGTFVTLSKQGRLRGCIGTIAPISPLAEDVRNNSINAAHKDPRFPPLKPEELENINIEVSILTTPVPLAYENATDLLRKIRPHRDGVILRYGLHNSTYLPQVWDQLPESEEFLSRLCLKAGLPADAWKKKKLEVLTYQVQHFNE
jgi:AmmeMemoRadiSam system protein B/AmmeMemoRadiSam system protein A